MFLVGSSVEDVKAVQFAMAPTPISLEISFQRPFMVGDGCFIITSSSIRLDERNRHYSCFCRVLKALSPLFPSLDVCTTGCNQDEIVVPP